MNWKTVKSKTAKQSKKRKKRLYRMTRNGNGKRASQKEIVIDTPQGEDSKEISQKQLQ